MDWCNRIFFCLFLVFCATSGEDFEESVLIRVTPRNQADVTFIQELEIIGVDIWLHGGVNSPVDIAVTNASFTRFTKLLNEEGIPHKVLEKDIQSLVKEEKKENIQAKHAVRRSISKRGESLDDIHTYYPTLSDVYKWLSKVEKSNPDIAKVTSIGKSYEGRDMKLLQISSKNKGKKKPKIWIDGGIHAREWISPSTVIYLIHQLLKEENRHIMEAFEWHILPVFNVDGYEYTFSKAPDARLWRKNRRNTGSFDHTNESIYGVDLNRNFDSNWMENGSSADPWSQVYAGDKPFSEPETRAVRDYLKEYSSNMLMYLSFHAYSEVILTPYGHTLNPPKNQDDIFRAVNATIGAIASVNGTLYEQGSAPAIMYAASGGSYDWAKIELGIPYSFVFELSPGMWEDGGFILPPKSILPVAKEVWEGMKALFSEIQK